MKKALLVVDVQDDFLGNRRDIFKFNYENDVVDLICNINEAITEYKNNGDEVIYISHVIPSSFINKKLIGYGISGTEGAKISEDIDIVSENYFEKQSLNAFKNNNLIKFIKERNITKVDIVGTNGCGEITATAVGAVDAGLEVEIIKEAVAQPCSSKKDRFCMKLRKLGVQYVSML